MLLSVPNVSEGRTSDRIDRLAAAFGSPAELLDHHSDAVHNRTVFTLFGDAAQLEAALLAGAAAAIDSIDMHEHTGAHPCVGALDVCPVVWLAEDDREQAAALARGLAQRIAGELDVPVFLYGELATAPDRRERAFFRRGGLPELERRMAGGALLPDFGPERPHPTAGVTLVSARPPLAAFNLELDSADLELGARVAGGLRESGGGLAGVRAIAIALDDGRIQISTNVHDPFTTPLARVVQEAQRLAGQGVTVTGTELIGLVPAAAMEGFPAELQPAGFDPDRHLIERRLAGRRA